MCGIVEPCLILKACPLSNWCFGREVMALEPNPHLSRSPKGKTIMAELSPENVYVEIAGKPNIR